MIGSRIAVFNGEARVPRLLAFDGRVVRRSFVPGRALYEARPRSRELVVLEPAG